MTNSTNPINNHRPNVPIVRGRSAKGRRSEAALLLTLLLLIGLLLTLLSLLGCREATGRPVGGATTGQPSTESDTESGPADTEGEDEPGPLELAASVKEIIDINCTVCHGGGPAGGKGGMNFFPDLAKIVENGVAVPFDLTSPLPRRVLEGSMPPTGGLSPEERELIQQWVLVGAPDVAGSTKDCSDNVRITFDQLIAAINVDLASIGNDASGEVAYIHFVDEYNAGACPEELDLLRDTLSRQLNSLSLENEIKRPVFLALDGQ
ncbi:MAG: hypothetical protein R3A51_23670, partial [Nannocystaceae bacterium]